MRTIILALIAFLFLGFTSVQSQKKRNLLGKWEYKTDSLRFVVYLNQARDTSDSSIYWFDGYYTVEKNGVMLVVDTTMNNRITIFHRTYHQDSIFISIIDGTHEGKRSFTRGTFAIRDKGDSVARLSLLRWPHDTPQLIIDGDTLGLRIPKVNWVFPLSSTLRRVK